MTVSKLAGTPALTVLTRGGASKSAALIAELTVLAGCGTRPVRHSKSTHVNA
jgi:hypothetical protein